MKSFTSSRVSRSNGCVNWKPLPPSQVAALSQMLGNISNAEECTSATFVTSRTARITRRRTRGGPFPFLTVKDMAEKGLSFAECSYIDTTEFEKARKVAACPEAGTVLFSKDGTVGKVHVVRHERPFAVLSSIAILRPDPSRLDSNFLGFALGNSVVLKDAVNRKTGSALQRTHPVGP